MTGAIGKGALAFGKTLLMVTGAFIALGLIKKFVPTVWTVVPGLKEF